jgi:hypothetical protein
MLRRDALTILRRMVTQTTQAMQRPCKTSELLTFVSKERIERWQRELVDVARMLKDGTADAADAAGTPPSLVEERTVGWAARRLTSSWAGDR